MLLPKIGPLAALSAVAVATTVFNVPQSPPPISGVLDPSPVSFGFPFATLPGYFVDARERTLNCLSTFQSLTGTWPSIRIGGTSEDAAFFVADLPVINEVAGQTELGHKITNYGPKFMELVASYKGRVVFGINRGSDNLTNAIAASRAAYSIIPSLYALELGNEPVTFPGTGALIAVNKSWTIAEDVASESSWQKSIGEALEITSFAQAASYFSGVERGWGGKEYFRIADPAADQYIAVFSHHNYPQSAINFSGSVPPYLPGLMSHINITKDIEPFIEDVQAVKEKNLQYVFGETNSVSGNGDKKQSPTFATGLWVLDYALQAASRDIVRLYFHQGTPGNSENLWWNETGLRSPIYGGYFAAEAMAHASHIAPLDNGGSNQAGYAIYATNKLTKVVLINSDYYDGVGERPSQSFSIIGLSVESVTAKRLTASSSLARQDQGDLPTFGGQSIDENTCKLVGHEDREFIEVVNGEAKVVLAASEALLITVSY